MAVQGFTGLETGDLSAVTVVSGTYTVVTDQVIGGNYSLKHTVTGAATPKVTIFSGLTASSVWARTWIRVHVTTPPTIQATNGSAVNGLLLFTTNSASWAAWISPVFNTNGTVALRCLRGLGAGTQVGSDIPIGVDTWYFVELKLICSNTSGTVEFRVNGVIQGTVSGVQTSTAGGTVVSINVQGGVSALNSLVAQVWWDNLSWSNSAYPGPGYCIARQGIAGTPTYNAWTKNGAATAALCWSDTPFNTATNCSSSTNSVAQTMLTASFSSAGTGQEGSGIIGATDVINACKAACIIKTTAGGSDVPSIRRRLNGADTDTSVTIALTTADAYSDSGVWIDTLVNLNSAEIGIVNGSGGSGTNTVEDMWIMVDYTPSPQISGTVSTSSQTLTPTSAVIVALSRTITTTSQAVSAAIVLAVSRVISTVNQAVSPSVSTILTLSRELVSSMLSVGSLISASISVTGAVSTISQIVSAAAMNVSLTVIEEINTEFQTISSAISIVSATLTGTISTARQAISVISLEVGGPLTLFLNESIELLTTLTSGNFSILVPVVSTISTINQAISSSFRAVFSVTATISTASITISGAAGRVITRILRLAGALLGIIPVRFTAPILPDDKDSN